MADTHEKEVDTDHQDAQDDEEEENEAVRTPVTVITGFLGAGKTTLTRYILTEMHGMKFAVIENEFGAVGVDDAILKENHVKSEEQVIEMMNGCVCCTVRQDLANVVKKLLDREDQKDPEKKFDGIIIETTGMADPSPVAQTFFVDEELTERCYLDGIITVVDAKHVLKRLADGRKDEESGEIMNECAEQLAFADRILLNKIDLVSKEELENIKSEIKGINSTATIIETERSKVDPKLLINIDGFNLDRILENDKDFLTVDKEDEEEHAHGHGHGHKKHKKKVHNQAVSSISFQFEGDIALPRMESWLREMLQEKGDDLYRYKGVIAVAGMEERYVFQGVHMLLEGGFHSPWKEGEKRVSKFVFIGKNLDKEAISKGFEGCKAYKLRFKVGDKVEVNCGEGDYISATVTKVWNDGYPYRIHPDDEEEDDMWVPDDTDAWIRPREDEKVKEPASKKAKKA